MAATILQYIVGGGLAISAFKLAWSVDRTQKEMLKIQAQQTLILQELTHRVDKLEFKIGFKP